MPGDYRCIDECDVFVTVYWGQLSLVDILDTISRRLHDPDLPSVKANVIDLSHATWTDIPPRYIHDELERLRPAFAPPKVRTILVAPSEFFYGFARMYALVQVVYGAAKVDVVRSWKEATAALGADLMAAESWARSRASSGADVETTRRISKPN
jgi:hypothetical protein